MTAQQIAFEHNGHTFPLYVGSDNQFYAYDPHGLMDGPHGSLPGAHPDVIFTAAASYGGLSGLSSSPVGSIASSVIPAALSFVPVVGPILGPIASVAASLLSGAFGGNDPVNVKDLVAKVVSLRQGIVQANLAMGRQDVMPVLPAGSHFTANWGGSPAIPIILESFPNNASIQDPNHFTCDKTGVNCPGCGNIRVCLYATINRLTPVAQQLAAQAHDTQLTQSIIAQLPSAQGATPSPTGTTVIPGGFYPTSTYTPTVSAPLEASVLPTDNLQSMLPWILAGGVILVAFSGKRKSR